MAYIVEIQDYSAPALDDQFPAGMFRFEKRMR